jgi:hypothetical protein
MTRPVGPDGTVDYTPDMNLVKPYPFILKPPRALSPDLSPPDLVRQLREALQGRDAVCSSEQVLGVNDDR